MVEIKKLSFKIDKITILKNIDLNIKKGRFIGIIGENGCGKSTLLKNIYKVYKSKNKTIFLDGMDLNSYTPKKLSKKIAVLSQEQKIMFDFRVDEIVEMGMYNKTTLFGRNNFDKEIDEALEKVGIKRLRDARFLTLSGGEMQRVLIARAIAQESDILLLDEPTNHLDVRYQYQIMDIVKKLNKTVIAVIHDINIASRYCDYIYAMKNGQIIYQGTVEEIFNSKIIKDVFEIDVEVISHPKNNRPVIIF